MIKYVNTMIVLSEVPDEISLAIEISNCPCHCPGCHSSYLAENIGTPLYLEDLIDLIEKNKGITTVCLMGGDANTVEINDVAYYTKVYYPNLKVAWYSGRQELSKNINLDNFDFIKLGPYIEELGPLTSKTTNQRFYKVIDNKLVDITYKFNEHETED